MGTQPPPTRSRIWPRFAAFVASSLAVLAAPLGAGATDLSGHWHTADGTFFVVEQADTFLRLTNTRMARIYEGSFDGTIADLSWTTPQYPESYSLTLSSDGNALTGDFHTLQCLLSNCTTSVQPAAISRCACWDGNTDSGDGCDVQCQVEPCFSCTAEPSTCSPAADSTPCEDPSDCVSGGTCSAGVCDGGIQADSCVDIGGAWTGTGFYYEEPYVWTHREQVVQSEGALSFFANPGGYRDAIGNLDTTTGVLSTSGNDAWPYCGLSGLDGVAAPDGRSYRGIHWYSASTPHGCVPLQVAGEVGLRCASADLQPTDGCIVDSCQVCSGNPATCVPVPDQTPCHSDDPCTVVASCQRGECVASVSDVCPVCTACDGSGGCVAGPRNNCRKTDDPASTKMSIRSTKGGSAGAFRWDWSDGGAIRPYDLGWPEAYSDVALCIFDESQPQPAELMRANVDHQYFGTDFIEGWTMDGNGDAQYRDRLGYLDGIVSIDLVTGAAGESRIRVKGKRGSLPVAPFALPLRAQLQIQGGACFEGTYGSAGVRHNAGGSFRAKGTP